jgi:hypothetical protein
MKLLADPPIIKMALNELYYNFSVFVALLLPTISDGKQKTNYGLKG